MKRSDTSGQGGAVRSPAAGGRPLALTNHSPNQCKVQKGEEEEEEKDGKIAHKNRRKIVFSGFQVARRRKFYLLL